MTETITAGAADPQSQYDADYYHSHCGDVPYSSDSPVWQAFYQPIADEIVRSLGPRRVFDAGCAVGFLVAALWDRNVEAHGRDISEFAISQVRADVRRYCSVGSIADPIDGDFDLILCIEVLEHMPEDEAIAAIATMTRAAPRILFSSTPSDFDEVSHVNVRPTLYWLRQFAAAGFAPVGSHDASYLCPHAILFERTDEGHGERDLVAFAEVIRQRILRADEHRQLVQTQSALESEQTARRIAEADWRAHHQAVEADLTKRLDDAQNHIQELHDRYRLSQVALRQAHRAARVAWWTVSLQLPARLQDRRERVVRDSAAPAAATGVDEVARGTTAARESIAREFGATDPLRTFTIPGSERRFSIVTDSVGEGFLYGGVGTAFILARLLAERANGRIRLITRTEPADLERVNIMLGAQGLAWPGEIEVLHAPAMGATSVPVGSGDVFLTTSWWTTRATIASVPARQVIYLLQEDERMFYPRGDERLRCVETLDTADLRIVVNSEPLFRHLAEGPEALPDMASRATWFEPAFPANLFSRDDWSEQDGRHRFLFYARPNNLRNLYWRGLEAITAAIEDGVLDPAQWTFTFVGRDLQPLTLPGGVVPELLENLPWDQYAEVVRGTDLGLALMDTPHASYPPLDLAASGAVVVTNSCGIKQSLRQYSENIITTPPGVADICRGLADGVTLALDTTRRRRQYDESRLHRDWRSSLEDTVQRCVDWIEG